MPVLRVLFYSESQCAQSAMLLPSNLSDQRRRRKKSSLLETLPVTQRIAATPACELILYPPCFKKSSAKTIF